MRHYLSRELVDPQYHRVGILVMGCGGTGSRVVSGLAQIHMALRALGHAGLMVRVFDGDAVSAANIGRQLFSPAEIGRNKAEAIVTRINLFFGLDWQAYPVMLSPRTAARYGELVDRVDIVITAVDNVGSRIFASADENVACDYWLDLGNSRDRGQVVLGTKEPVSQPKDGAAFLPTVLDLFPAMIEEEQLPDQGPSCSMEAALRQQDLFINQAVADAALQLLWKGFRTGHLEVHGAFVNVATMTTRPIPVDPAVWSAMGFRESRIASGPEAEGPQAVPKAA